MLPEDRYRGTVVEVCTTQSDYIHSLTPYRCRQDLQLPPAFALPADESISRAIEFAYERDFSHIP